MNTRARKRAPGGGRKPAGEGGARVADYPALMLRFPVETLAQLRALSAVRKVPLWRLVNQAVVGMLAKISDREADAIRPMARREAAVLMGRKNSKSSNRHGAGSPHRVGGESG